MMRGGFGWAAWLDARRRVSKPDANRFDRNHGRADERAARAALRPHTGHVAPSSVNPPIRKP